MVSVSTAVGASVIVGTRALPGLSISKKAAVDNSTDTFMDTRTGADKDMERDRSAGMSVLLGTIVNTDTRAGKSTAAILRARTSTPASNATMTGIDRSANANDFVR